MNDAVEKKKEQEKENQEKFAVQIVYNGVTKSLEVEGNKHATRVLIRCGVPNTCSLARYHAATSVPVTPFLTMGFTATRVAYQRGE
jgi:hypothetical protein